MERIWFLLDTLLERHIFVSLDYTYFHASQNLLGFLSVWCSSLKHGCMLYSVLWMICLLFSFTICLLWDDKYVMCFAHNSVSVCIWRVRTVTCSRTNATLPCFTHSVVLYSFCQTWCALGHLKCSFCVCIWMKVCNAHRLLVFIKILSKELALLFPVVFEYLWTLVSYYRKNTHFKYVDLVRASPNSKWPDMNEMFSDNYNSTNKKLVLLSLINSIVCYWRAGGQLSWWLHQTKEEGIWETALAE